jgi:hypothetical protein
MSKRLLPERQLVEKINDALPAWEVVSVRRVHKSTANWEAEFRTRDRRLATIDCYEAEYLPVLDELEAKYDVDWSAQIEEA